MIIVFSGVDGAGKSTQIDLLKKQISEQSIPVESIWSRGGYTPGFELIKKIIRIILGKKSTPSGRGKKRDKVMSNPLVGRLWLIVAMLDLLVLYAIVIRFKSLLGRVVICDRYLGDTFIDFSLNFPEHDFEKIWLWKLLVIFSPNPDASFLFTLPVEDSMQRSKLKNEPFPDSKDTLKNRIAIYKKSSLFNAKNWTRINGLDSIEFNANVIKKIFLQLKGV